MFTYIDDKQPASELSPLDRFYTRIKWHRPTLLYIEGDDYSTTSKANDVLAQVRKRWHYTGFIEVSTHQIGTPHINEIMEMEWGEPRSATNDVACQVWDKIMSNTFCLHIRNPDIDNPTCIVGTAKIIINRMKNSYHTIMTSDVPWHEWRKQIVFSGHHIPDSEPPFVAGASKQKFLEQREMDIKQLKVLEI